MDSIPGDVGIGLEIAVNEYTRAEFGNPERFEKYASANDRKFTDMAIRFGGVLLMRGTLIITNATRETYSGWLQSDLGVLGTAQRDKFITDMAWLTTQTFSNKKLYDPETDNYACVTVQNPVFWEGKGKSEDFTFMYTDEFGNTKPRTIQTNHLTKAFKANQNGRVNNMQLDGTLYASGEACVISPYLSLNRIIAELFRLNGFFIDHVSYKAIGDYDYFALLIYNNYNIFTQTFTTEAAPLNYFDDDLQMWVTVNSTEVLSATWSIGTFNYTDLLPRIALKDFLLGIQNLLNIVFLFRKDKTVKIVNRNTIPETAAYNLDAYFMGFWNIGEQKDVKLKFSQEHDDNDELTGDWHDLTDRLADFGAPVADIAALQAIASPSLGELRLVTSLNKIYEYKWAVFDGTDEEFRSRETDILEWVFASTGNQPYIYGTSDEIEEIKTSCSTLPYNNDGSLVVPVTLYTRQQGNISSSRRLWGDFDFRLIHYDRTLYDKGKLEFDGEFGLFNVRWKKWANFWKSRLPVEAEFMVPLNVLSYMIENITQPYSTRHGKFIIEEMECDFRGEEMSTVKIRGYKL